MRAAALGIVALTAAAAAAAPDEPAVPPDEVLKAWEDAGAGKGELGWSDTQTDRMDSFGKTGRLFVFTVGPDVKAATLPVPAVPFGVGLRMQAGDAVLKALPTAATLRAVNAYGQPVTDDGLKELARQTGLEYLDLGRTKVTTAGMKHLAALPKLHTLHVDSVEVGDDGLKELVKIKTLRSLNVDETKITFTGLEALAGMANLETLGVLSLYPKLGGKRGLGEWVTGLPKLATIRHTFATDADLALLARVPTLRRAAVPGDDVTDAGLKPLTGLAKLEEVTVSSDKVTDAGVAVLAGIKSLKAVRLNCKQVTDAGLKSLAALPNLQTVRLYGQTKVTDAAAEAFRKARPTVKLDTR